MKKYIKIIQEGEKYATISFYTFSEIISVESRIKGAPDKSEIGHRIEISIQGGNPMTLELPTSAINQALNDAIKIAKQELSRIILPTNQTKEAIERILIQENGFIQVIESITA